jgi:hypothetical protein
MRELCERRDRGWRIRKRILKLHTIALPHPTVRTTDCGVWPATETRGCRKNHFTAVPRRHTKFEAETATDVGIDRETVNQTCSGSCEILRTRLLKRAKTLASRRAGEKVPTEVSRNKVSRDKVHRDEAHRHKVGQSKIRRAKNRRKRPEAPRYRRASRLGAEHHAELLPQTVGAGVEPG